MDMYLNANEQNSQQFWNLYLKARMLKKKGDIKAARKVSERSLELAKAAENDFGYIKLNTDFLNDL